MEPFATLTAAAVPYFQADVDTDRIIPHRFLRKPLSAGYRNFLFCDERLDSSGRERPEFVLNQPQYRDARILVVGRNFGCGSAREGAVYAIKDWGLRVIIAPSYADFFKANCVQNGVLPVELEEAVVAQIVAEVSSSPGKAMTVDLEAQTVLTPSGQHLSFQFDALRKEQLLKGLDDIAYTMQRAAEISRFEQCYFGRVPWLRPDQTV